MMPFGLSHPDVDTRGADTPLRFRERVRQRVGEADLLVFRVGRERFALELRAVDEAVEAPELRPVPECDGALRGVFVLREHLLPLYSAERVLGTRERDDHVALVVRHGARRIGLAVDDVDDVLHIAMRDLRDAPAGAGHEEVVAGLLLLEGNLVTVLDARALAAACVTPATGAAA